MAQPTLVRSNKPERPSSRLAHRLPNPPPLFVGRSQESADLTELIKRAPVTVVWGVGGVGKTSLVLATLRRRPSAQIERTVMLGLRPADAPGQVQLQLVRALACPQSIGPEWATGAYDADTYAAGVIDLAERGNLWVVLDDLHYGDPAFVHDLMTRVARFARRSRWIATSRVRPEIPELTHQVLGLGAMSERDLEELACKARPGHSGEARARAVRAATGSPWQLLRALGSGEAREPLSDLGDSRQLFDRLALIAVAVPVEALTPLGAEPERLAELERGGLIEHTEGGVRVHDVARSLVDAERAARERHTVGLALAGANDPEAALEGARLLLEAGDETAVHVLTGRADDLLQAGCAPRLWRMVKDSSNPALRIVRLRCAGELGDAHVVAGLERPPPEDADAALLWACAKFAAGQCREAGEVAAALAAHQQPELAFGAGMLLSRCHGFLGRPHEALAVLEGLTPPSTALALSRDAHRARWMVQVDPACARVLADRVRAALPSLPERLRREAAERLGSVYVSLGCYLLAAELLPELREDHTSLFLSREVMLWRLAVAISGGRLVESAELTRQLRSQPSTSTLQHQLIELFDSSRRIAVGELQGLDEELAAHANRAGAAGSAQMYYQATLVRERLAFTRGEPSPVGEWSSSVPRPVGPNADHLTLYRRWHEMRWGLIPDVAEVPEVPESNSDFIALRVADTIFRAELALLREEQGAALAATARALALVREHGHVLTEMDVLLFRCKVAAVFGGPGLSNTVAEVDVLTRKVESPRFQAEMLFFRAVEGSAWDAAALEECASCIAVAPAAARRARRLLGCRVTLDALDSKICACLEQRAQQRLETLVPPTFGVDGWLPGWGLDVTRQAVWLPGRWVDLTATPLSQRLIEVLVAAGGAISKADLVRLAWEVSDYHPLRHDKRTQVAIHRLRRQIEDDPVVPRRLVTTADGYALGAGFRRMLPLG